MYFQELRVRGSDKTLMIEVCDIFYFCFEKKVQCQMSDMQSIHVKQIDIWGKKYE